MKTILCYGDSNTYGYDPVSGGRFDHNTRWPGVLRNELGEGWWVIEEGCGGRTTVWEDPIERHKDGSAYLPACLHSHGPLDLVIILLGTNDLKHRFGLSPEDIARGAGVLVDICKKSGEGIDGRPPSVLLLAPPPLEKVEGTPFADMFAAGRERSQRFSECFRQVAQEQGCEFLDLKDVIVSSKLDAIHLEAAEHAKLGRAVAGKVREVLG
jgi:lysophospholipase L1-like esterase